MQAYYRLLAVQKVLTYMYPNIHQPKKGKYSA